MGGSYGRDTVVWIQRKSLTFGCFKLLAIQIVKRKKKSQQLVNYNDQFNNNFFNFNLWNSPLPFFCYRSFFFRMCILKDIYHILLIILTMTMLYAVVPLRYTSVPMSEHLQYQTIFVFMSFFCFFFFTCAFGCAKCHKNIKINFV